jgi:hypothetical protein
MVVVVEEELAGGFLGRDLLDADGEGFGDEAVRTDLVAAERIAGDLAGGEVGLPDAGTSRVVDELRFDRPAEKALCYLCFQYGSIMVPEPRG